VITAAVFKDIHNEPMKDFAKSHNGLDR